MAVTATVTIDSSGVGAGVVPASGNVMAVTLPSSYSADVGLAIVYQEGTPSGVVYYGFSSSMTASGAGTSTDGVPIPTGGLAGAIPAKLLKRQGVSTLYLAATAGTPVSFLLL